MADPRVRPINPQSKTKLSAAISAAWGRIGHKMGKGAFADAAEFDQKTIDRALTGPTLPSAENLLNSLCADPTALAEVLGLYGLKISLAVADPANDFDLAADLSGAVTEMIDRLRDGKLDHVDTAVLAEKFRELIPHMQAIVDEADRRKVA